MPIRYSRKLTGSLRHERADQQLGTILAFTAGAINAGGFLAVQQYTSHMTGIVSGMADGIVLGAHSFVLAGFGAVISFIVGAALCAMMVNYARRHQMHSIYAMPLFCEALLLLCFGFLGAKLNKIDGLFVPVTVMLLSFLMGLQNALITKLSKAEIRTTHITGIVTDIGIELGKMAYWNRSKLPSSFTVTVDKKKLKMLSVLVIAFFIGGIVGACGFKYLGYITTVPIAVMLITLSIAPLIDDIRCSRKM